MKGEGATGIAAPPGVDAPMAALAVKLSVPPAANTTLPGAVPGSAAAEYC